MSLYPPKYREVKDQRRFISDFRMEHYHFSVRKRSVCMFESGQNLNIYSPRWRNGSVFVLHTNGGGSIPPRGTKFSSHYTRGAGSVYWKIKVVRIRQPDCKSGPHGSGSSPLFSTKWWISVWKNVDNSDYNKRNYNPLPVHSKTTIKQSRVRRNGYLTII